MTIRDVGQSFRKVVLDRVGRFAGRVQETRPLDVDVLESDSDYLVIFDAPGVQKQDIQVQFMDGSVQVRIERFREYRDDFEMRFPGRGLSLEGEARLPSDAEVDAENATATLRESGVLDIRIPKSEKPESVESETVSVPH